MIHEYNMKVADLLKMLGINLLKDNQLTVIKKLNNIILSDNGLRKIREVDLSEIPRGRKTVSRKMIEDLEKAWTVLHNNMKNPSENMSRAVLKTINTIIEEKPVVDLFPLIARTIPIITNKDSNIIIAVPPHNKRETSEIEKMSVPELALITYIGGIIRRITKVDLDKNVIEIPNKPPLQVTRDQIYKVAYKLGLDDVTLKIIENEIRNTDKLRKYILEIKQESITRFIVTLDSSILNDETKNTIQVDTIPVNVRSVVENGKVKYEGTIRYTDDIVNIPIIVKDKPNLDQLITELVSNFEAIVRNYYIKFKEIKKSLEEKGFEWNKISDPYSMGWTAEKTDIMGENRINTIILVRYDTIKKDIRANSLISIRGPVTNILERVIPKLPRDKWLVKKEPVVSLSDTNEKYELVLFSSRPEDITKLVGETLNVQQTVKRLIEKIMKKVEIEATRTNATPEDYLILYLTKVLFLPSLDLYEVTGKSEIQILDIVSDLLRRNGIYEYWDTEEIGEELRRKPKDVIEKLLEEKKIRMDDNAELLIMSKHIEDSLSKFPRLVEKYSINILANKLKEVILTTYYEIVRVTPVKVLIASKGMKLDLIRKLIRYGSPVDIDDILLKVNGDVLINKLTPLERSKVMSKMSITELETLLHSKYITKEDAYTIIKNICKRTDSSRCTEEVLNYNPKLAGIPKNVKITKINEETHIDTGTYTIQVSEIGIVNEYVVMSKIDNKKIRVKAKTLAEAIRKVVKKNDKLARENEQVIQ